MLQYMHDVLCWHAPGSRETVIFLREELEHPVHVTSQQIFATNLNHTRKMVNFLQIQERNKLIASSMHRLESSIIIHLVSLHIHDSL